MQSSQEFAATARKQGQSLKDSVSVLELKIAQAAAKSAPVHQGIPHPDTEETHQIHPACMHRATSDTACVQFCLWINSQSTSGLAQCNLATEAIAMPSMRNDTTVACYDS